jgi:hypothetical protein
VDIISSQLVKFCDIMSERMIEIQRAKMGIAAPAQNGGTGASNSSSEGTSRIVVDSSHTQDERLRNFLTRLKDAKPTVPPSLTRRILNKQGVGFADPLVSTIVSSAADQFLATVLSQALVCRDRRLKGEELAKKEKRELDRVEKRRRAEEKSIESKKRKLEADLEEMVKKGSKGSLKHDKVSSELIHLLETNTFDVVGKKNCIDDEENYYRSQEARSASGEDNNDNGIDNQNYEEDEFDEDESDDEDDDKDLLHLRDLVRPLGSWGFSLAGKMGLAPEHKASTKVPNDKSDENDVVDDEDGLDGEDGGADLEKH